MRRGEIVIVSAPGDYGKPRPAVIVQSDLYNDTHASVVVCLLTSDVQDAPLFRVDIEPTSETGLERRSQVMVDKIVTMRRQRLGKRVGKVGDDTLTRIDRSLALFLGLAE